MLRRIVAFWLILTMVFGALAILDTTVDFFQFAGAETLYVNETGGNGTYTSIQDAIDDAGAGDTVFVYSGQYSGNILVNKTIDLMGEDKNTTVIEGTGSGVVVNITADWVNMSHFTIANVGSGPGDKAIELNNGDNCTVTEVEILYSLKFKTTIDGQNISVSDFICYTLELSVVPTIDGQNISVSDTIVLTLDYGSGPIYYNTSIDDSFSHNITVVGPSDINCTYSISYNDTFEIQVKEIHDWYPISITYPNASHINITTVPLTHVNFTFIKSSEVENCSIVYTLEYANTTGYPNYVILDNSIINRSYPQVIDTTYVFIISARVNLTAIPGDGHVLLHWRTQSFYEGQSVLSYRIYRSTPNGPEIMIAEVGSSTYSYMDVNVQNGVTYNYTVRAYTGQGEGPPSNEVSAHPRHNYNIYDTLTAKIAGLIWWLWIIISFAGALVFVGVVKCHLEKKRRI